MWIRSALRVCVLVSCVWHIMRNVSVLVEIEIEIVIDYEILRSRSRERCMQTQER